MKMHFNAKSAHTSQVTADDNEPFRSVHLGLVLLDVEGLVEDDTRLASWSHDILNAIVTDGYCTNDTEPLILFQNGHAMIMDSARHHCSFDGEDCWTVRVHPKITEISKTYGYAAGGQELRISGWGFNGTDVSVKIDGVDCEVKSAERETIVCTTGLADSASEIGYQPGQPGLT